MITRLYAIFDTKAAAYLQPFFMATTLMAIRAFTTEANNPQSFIHRHPADYTLCLLGMFDDATGNLDAVGPHPEVIATAASVLRPHVNSEATPDLLNIPPRKAAE